MFGLIIILPVVNRNNYLIDCNIKKQNPVKQKPVVGGKGTKYCGLMCLTVHSSRHLLRRYTRYNEE